VKLPNQLEERLPVSFKASDMHLPPGVDVLAFEPTETEIVLESLESKEVRVEVPRLGQLRSGLTLDGIQISPKTVIVRGPRTEVRQLKSVETEPIDLRELEGSEKVELRLRGAGSQATLSTEKVSALIEVSQIPSERTFKGRTVELRAVVGLGNLRVEPAEVSVVVSAPADIVSNIESHQIIPYVRLREAPTSGPGGVFELQVEVETPQGSKVVRIEPNRVAIRGDLPKPPPQKTKSKGK
jgi:YbbR domain-containing protein